MVKPWFVAVEKFGPGSGETWTNYIEYSGLNQLKEIVSLDDGLCPEVIKELTDEDRQHNVDEDYVWLFFRDLDYLLQKVANYSDINILATIRDPKVDCKDCYQDKRFEFLGYDLVEVHGATSALTNCGGFEQAFENKELSEVGLISSFERAREIQQLLQQHYPGEHDAKCDVWAIWKMKIYRGKLGVPDLTLAGLQVWIHNREFPDLLGSFDGDWLVVTVHCGGQGADVWAQGPIIHLSEIAIFLKQVELMIKTFKGQAKLCDIEPNFFAQMEIGKRGDVSLIVEITPDHLSQQHKFVYDIDQSYLPPLIRDLKTILKKYPVKDRKAKY